MTTTSRLLGGAVAAAVALGATAADAQQARTLRIAMTATEFGHEVGARFGESATAAKNYVDDLAEVEVLFVDDLGKWKLTDRVESELWHIIEHRSQRLLPILVTMNAGSERFRPTVELPRALIEKLVGRAKMTKQ